MPRPRWRPRSGGELLLLTDTDGVRGADGQRIPSLDTAEAERLIADGVIDGGMVPKVRAALRAIGPGSAATRAIVADGRAPDAVRRSLAEASGTVFRVDSDPSRVDRLIDRAARHPPVGRPIASRILVGNLVHRRRPIALASCRAERIVTVRRGSCHLLAEEGGRLTVPGVLSLGERKRFGGPRKGEPLRALVGVQVRRSGGSLSPTS